MSTEYAVKLSLPDFLEHSVGLGFKPQLHREEDGGSIRLRLVGGSPRGFVYDPRQERARDVTVWTLFTRYGHNDVSGLSGPLGAITEHDDEFAELFNDQDPEDMSTIEQRIVADGWECPGCGWPWPRDAKDAH